MNVQRRWLVSLLVGLPALAGLVWSTLAVAAPESSNPALAAHTGGSILAQAPVLTVTLSPGTPSRCPLCPVPAGGPTCGSCLPVDPWTLEQIEEEAVLVARGAAATTNLSAPVSAAPEKVILVWINAMTMVPKPAGVWDAADLFGADGQLTLGVVPDNAPSGLFVAVPCTGECGDPEAALAAIGTGTTPWAAYKIEPKISDLQLTPATAGAGVAEHIDLSWLNADSAPTDQITIVWSKDGETIAEWSDTNPLQRTFGFLEPTRDGTRLYNTPLVNVAPLLPDLMPGLASDLPAGEYGVDVYINGALEGAETVALGQ